MAEAANPDAVRATIAHQALGHPFTDVRLLRQACTHASRCGAQASPERKRQEANERLEFLGDALLGASLCLQLYQRFPDASEGELSRWKAKLASREVLALAIERTGLLAHCLVGSQLGGDGPDSWPVSVKANLCESLLAAVFSDGGWDALHHAVGHLLGPLLEDPQHGLEDTRMRLQAWCHATHKALPTYTCARSGGTDHAPEFTAIVTIGTRTAQGSGASRKRAEGEAAAAMLVQIDGDQP